VTTRAEKKARRRRIYRRQEMNQLRKAFPFICWEKVEELWRRHLCGTHGAAERKRDEIERDGGEAIVTRWVM
jgi:hypothetical protein